MKNFILLFVVVISALTLMPVKAIANENAQQENEENAAENKASERYRRYLEAHPESMEALLNNKCKLLFQNPWYKFDKNTNDDECDVAASIKHQNERMERQKELYKNRKETRDKAYFTKNNEAAVKTSNECKSGKIENLEECEAAIYITHEKIEEESKKNKYAEYYNSHPLDAKFFVAWCKKTMVNFNIKCQAANDALEKYNAKKPKTYNEKNYEKYVRKFTDNPSLAKDLMEGKCKNLMADKWYYLDDSIRSEQCDAAADSLKAGE